MTQRSELPGFEQPQQPQDKWTAQLYEKHGLGEAPTLEQIEPIATTLLGNPLDLLAGASLVLGREVDAQEKQLLVNLLMAGDAEHRFGVLLLTKAAEVEAAKKRK